jgi:transcriptional regulator with XRE-family HTH domain
MAKLKAIGARVRELRLTEGIGQEELAAAIGVSRSTIAGIETGGDRGGIETMVAIADHYKVSMDWLLDRQLPPGDPPVGKLIYRPDQIRISNLWDNLPIEVKESWLQALGLLDFDPARFTSTSRVRRRNSRK